jgi:hypothetical protein
MTSGKKGFPNWKEGLIVTVVKKVNLSECKNWRGIRLLCPQQNPLQNYPRQNARTTQQAGLRKNNSCTDHIALLRIIFEQCIVWQSSLFINFVDFEKAFDSLGKARQLYLCSTFHTQGRLKVLHI